MGILKDPGKDQGLYDLFLADMGVNEEQALLRSGGPYQLTEDELLDLRDQRHTLSFVAIDLTSRSTICHVSMHRKTTVARGTTAGVELVVTHPEFLGRRIAQRLMICAIQTAQCRWRHLRKVTLTSNETRVAARTMYTKLGFQLHGVDRFDLTLDDSLWCPIPYASMGLIHGFDAERTIWRMGVQRDELRNAVLKVCKGIEWWMAPQAPMLIEPLGVYRHQPRLT